MKTKFDIWKKLKEDGIEKKSNLIDHFISNKQK